MLRRRWQRPTSVLGEKSGWEWEQAACPRKRFPGAPMQGVEVSVG